MRHFIPSITNVVDESSRALLGPKQIRLDMKYVVVHTFKSSHNSLRCFDQERCYKF